LKIETEEERKLFKQGEENYNAKKAMMKTALSKQTPNDEESDLIHAMWLKQLEYHGGCPPHGISLSNHLMRTSDPNVSARKPDNVAYMDSTKLHSAQIMQPQYRNRHNFMIFGGFLLKQTFELAFCCAASFSHTRPTFISLDPSTFNNPVPVGSVLYLTAHVVYTDPPLVCSGTEAPNTTGQTRVQIRVDSKVRDVQHGETKPTGQFNYTFLIAKDVKIMPRTYSEFMMWVDARRRAMKVAASTANSDTSAASGSSSAEAIQERLTE
jgi:acyl-coenzyme A thioesterase 9